MKQWCCAAAFLKPVHTSTSSIPAHGSGTGRPLTSHNEQCNRRTKRSITESVPGAIALWGRR